MFWRGSMDYAEKQKILDKFFIWFKESLIVSHKKNSLKCKKLKNFKINPFTVNYLSYFLEGNADPRSLAKVLIYPKVLGTSISTTFGAQMQIFLTKELDAYGSTTKGIDIEFYGQDGKKKYCQLKSGPDAINKDDVKTVIDHFDAVRNLARTNSLDVGINDLLCCVLYGDPSRKNANMKKLEAKERVLVGNEFWTEFTGDEGFYKDLISVASAAAKEVNKTSIVEEIVDELSEEIKNSKLF